MSYYLSFRHTFYATSHFLLFKMIAATVFFYYALYSSTVDSPAVLYRVSGENFSPIQSFPSSNRFSWSVQELRAGTSGSDFYVFDGNTGDNNIGNSAKVFYLSSGQASPIELLNVTRYGCQLNDLVVSTTTGVVAVCGQGSGNILVFRSPTTKAQLKLVANISQTTYDDSPTIFFMGPTLVIASEGGNIFTSPTGESWTQNNPPMDSTLVYDFQATACSSTQCILSASSCLFHNNRCQTYYGPYFFILSEAGTWSQVNAQNEYSFACAAGDGSFFLSDGTSLFNYVPGKAEKLLFNGTATEFRFQAMHCDRTQTQAVYFAGYEYEGTGSSIRLFDGASLSTVAKNTQDWHITVRKFDHGRILFSCFFTKKGFCLGK
jgi:hypothetical protein